MKKLKLEEFITTKSSIAIVHNTRAITGGNESTDGNNNGGGVFDPKIKNDGGG